VTRISHRMQKDKLGVTCPDTHFLEIASGPPEHEKYCVKVSHPGITGMHYVTHSSHRMQKHKFGVMCPCALFVKSELSPPGYNK
jgi:hypothetical protein